MNVDPVTAKLLAMGPFGRADAPFGLVELRGPDAADYLQRLCSQDVLGMAPGRVRPAAFLDAKGKLLVTCLVTRLGESFWLELQTEQEARLLELLERYHFAEKLTIGKGERGSCHEVIGSGAHTGWDDARAHADGGAIVLACERHGVRFTRSHGGPIGLVPREDQEQVATKPLGPDLAECLRMAAGFVRVGVETEPGTLALEADLDDHCSTTKGCYTGQEIVARIHTYGHTNRKLCLLHLAAGPAIGKPEPLHELEDRIAVGRVMHAVPVPGCELRCGLGYLPKDFQAVGTKLALASGAEVTVVR